MVVVIKSTFLTNFVCRVYLVQLTIHIHSCTIRSQEDKFAGEYSSKLDRIKGDLVRE